MVGLDTSVVVRLLIGEPVAQADTARQIITDATRGSVAISDLVVGETYFALRHHYQVPHAKAVASLRTLLADQRVQPTGVARQVLDELPDRDSAPGLMDRLIHGGYERGGITLVTFDREAARLAGARLA